MKKSLTSLVLAVFMVMSLCIPASADESTSPADGNEPACGKVFETHITLPEEALLPPPIAPQDDIADWDTIVQQASESIVYHASNLELGDLDFSHLYLSEKIPTYELINNRLVPLDIDYYPILEDGRVTALLLTYEVDGEILTQLTSALVDVLNEYLTINTKIALIFDAVSLYATDGRTLTKLLDSAQESPLWDRIDFYGAASFSDSQIGFLSRVVCRSVSEAAKLECDIVPLDVPVSHRLDVDYVANISEKDLKEDEEGICWACCVASIGNFLNYTPKYLTGQSVSEWRYGGNKGGYLNDVIECLEGIYEVSYTAKSNAVLHFFSTIEDSTYAGYPVYGSMDNSGSDSYHAVVFSGFWINGTSKYGCYLMDPNVKGIHMATQSENGGIHYISAENGNHMQLLQAAYHR